MSKSLYQMYSNQIMEVVRTLTIEELMCVAHDVVMALNQDRIRDVGPARVAGLGDPTNEPGIRPGWLSLNAVEHAMLTANMEVPGVQSPDDVVEMFGEEEASVHIENKQKIVAIMERISEIMETRGVPMFVAIEILRHEDAELVVDVPDDLSGFGWGV